MPRNKPTHLLPSADPLWYRDAIIYELHIRAFYDSDGDGMGDFKGLAQKLDYLQDLGITVIWLLPFYPSPWKDDGYDISDYGQVHPAYGTLADFKLFLREAHRRGLRVITEVVLNHTSDQHAWFQRARRAPSGSAWRNFYVWSDTADRYKEARIIFKDFEASNWTWDPLANAYYWHRFYAHQPDLNFDNPEVVKAVFRVVDYWLDLGVDGLRLDAIPYLYEREQTNCENLAETHQFLKALRQHIDQKYQERMLLAEANQWPEDAVAYFGGGDQCHMAFHFPLMPRMFMGVRMEDRYPIIDILDQTPQLPDTCQWALFLRNHDELTLEMVTDEERDYMYRVYALDPRARINLGIRRRLSPLLGNDRKKIELMNALLFSLPGTPVLYYGDEIGMGDNIYLGDRNGVRTPMQWSADRNAGFSRANPQRLYLPIIIDPDYHYEVVNVEARQNNPHSVLWFTKRLIALRKRYRAFGRGTLQFLYPENHKVLAFIRHHQSEALLVIANLSRFVQYVELDLSAFKDAVPVEVFGQTEFPPIRESPYLISVGPHAFYWFVLQPQSATIPQLTTASAATQPPITVSEDWQEVFEGKARAALEQMLPSYLESCHWYGGKGRSVTSSTIVETVPFPYGSAVAYAALVEVRHREGDSQTYLLPLAYAPVEQPAQESQTVQRDVLARLIVKKERKEAPGAIYDALGDGDFCRTLMGGFARRRRLKAARGETVFASTRIFHEIYDPAKLPQPSILKGEQRNTSIVYGDRFILKLFRRLAEGINPELELGLFLMDRTSFRHVPSIAGAIEYRPKKGEPVIIGVLEAFVPNEGDAWKYTLDILGRYFERAAAKLNEAPPAGAVTCARLLELAGSAIPNADREMVGSYLESARLLGLRTAELHLALASDSQDPRFAPEAFSTLYQRSIYQSMRNDAGQVLELLRKRLRALPELTQADARKVLDLRSKVMARFQLLIGRKITALRTRVHGDYHLGEVLYTGKDFVIIDFEGESHRPLSARRIKRSPLIDVAGMLRSFQHASYSALFEQVGRGVARAEDLGALERWAGLWNRWVSATFFKSYLEIASQGGFLPQSRDELLVLLNAHLLDEYLRELGDEIERYPDRVQISLAGILQIMETEA